MTRTAGSSTSPPISPHFCLCYSGVVVFWAFFAALLYLACFLFLSRTHTHTLCCVAGTANGSAAVLMEIIMKWLFGWWLMKFLLLVMQSNARCSRFYLLITAARAIPEVLTGICIWPAVLVRTCLIWYWVWGVRLCLSACYIFQKGLGRVLSVPFNFQKGVDKQQSTSGCFFFGTEIVYLWGNEGWKLSERIPAWKVVYLPHLHLQINNNSWQQWTLPNEIPIVHLYARVAQAYVVYFFYIFN